MPNFCSHCGARSSGDRFCPQCGRAYPEARPEQPVYVPPAAQPPAQPPTQPPAQRPVQPQSAPPTGPPSTFPPAGPQEWAAPAAVRSPQSTPGSLRVGDLVRDVTAFLLLLLALFLPWDVRGSTADHWWALMPVLLAIVGISVTHIARVLPVTPVVVQLAKLVAVGPLLLVALVTVVREALRMVDVGDGGGIGAGVALALAGAVLVVQPRAADDLTGRTWELAWWGVTVLAAAGAVLLAVVTWLWYLVDDVGFELLWNNKSLLPSFLAVLVRPLLVVGVPLALLLAGRAAGRLLLATLGFTWLALLALAKLSGSGDGPDRFLSVALLETWAYPTAAVFLVGVAAAAAVARGTARRTAGDGVDPRGRSGAAGWALLVAAALLLLDGGVLVLEMLLEEQFPGAVLAVALLALVGGGLLLAGWAACGTGQGAPVVSLILAAGAVVLGVVVTTVRLTADVFSYSGLDPVFVLGWFVLPGLALATLLWPHPVDRSADGAAPAAQ